MNYADLIRLKWTNIQGKHILFTRMKTENTRKHNVRQIVVPISPNLRKLIDKIGVKNSPFVLGILEEGYDEKNLANKKAKLTCQTLSVIAALPINKRSYK